MEGGGGRRCGAPKGSEGTEGATNRALVAQLSLDHGVSGLGGRLRAGLLGLRSSLFFTLGGREEGRE